MLNGSQNTVRREINLADPRGVCGALGVGAARGRVCVGWWWWGGGVGRLTQGVGRDAVAGRLVHGYALEVREQRLNLGLVETHFERRALLFWRERRQAQLEEAVEARRSNAIGSRRDEDYVALQREHLGHVPLDLVASLSALVQAIHEQERAPRCDRLPKHAVEQGLRLAQRELQVRDDPVGGGRKLVGLLKNPRLQLLHPDQDGQWRVGRGIAARVEQMHDRPADQGALAHRRTSSQEHRSGVVHGAALRQLREERTQPLDQRLGRLDALQPRVAAVRDVDVHALPPGVELPSRQRVADALVPLAHHASVFGVDPSKNGRRHEPRPVIPGVQRKIMQLTAVAEAQ